MKPDAVEKLYKITYETTRYANSYVRAYSKEEARQKAISGEGEEDFEEEDELGDWTIEEINEVEEKE